MVIKFIDFWFSECNMIINKIGFMFLITILFLGTNLSKLLLIISVELKLWRNDKEHYYMK